MFASSSGDDIAACAAIGALCSPVDLPIPNTALPASLRIVFTSAKSTLITPGWVISPEIPLTPLDKISSDFK